MIIEGREFQKLKDYVKSGRGPWAHDKSVKKAIKILGFPAQKFGRDWWIDVKNAELWIKRRMKQAI